MAEEQPSLHIDTDWKRQAQEEKKRLAEQEQQRREEEERRKASAPALGPIGAAGAAVAPGAVAPGAGGAAAGARAAAARGESGLPQANFATLVQSILTQILFYLGELSPRGAEPQVNLDMAKHNIDMLSVIEDKTRGNLSEAEQHLLDNALYETRMRYVAIASQYATV